MIFPKFYVESDGDHVPKDVYICAGDGLGRVATVEGLSESTKFKLARRIATACNTIDAVTAQRDALLEACKAAESDLSAAIKRLPRRFSDRTDYGVCVELLDRLRAAIALCNGGAK